MYFTWPCLLQISAHCIFLHSPLLRIRTLCLHFPDMISRISILSFLGGVTHVLNFPYYTSPSVEKRHHGTRAYGSMRETILQMNSTGNITYLFDYCNLSFPPNFVFLGTGKGWMSAASKNNKPSLKLVKPTDLNGVQFLILSDWDWH